MSEPDGAAELTPPDIEPYRQGNTGVDFVTTFESGRSGPHVMIMAAMHGNEASGAIVLDELFRAGIRPQRGRLTLAFGNVAAYQPPGPLPRAALRLVDEDLNRVWGTLADRTRDSTERRRARALQPVLSSVDFLLDLHSMQSADPPLMLAGPLPKGRAFARALGYPEFVVLDAGHPNGMRLRDWGAFGDRTARANALLLEAGQHRSRSSAHVAMQATLRFLGCLDTVDRAALSAWPLDPLPSPQRVVEVTEAVVARTDCFRFLAERRGMDVVPAGGTVIAEDGDRPVRTPYDDCVLIMPSRRARTGQTAVRLGRFVA